MSPLRHRYDGTGGVLFSGCLSVCPSVSDHVVSTISHKPLVDISPNLPLQLGTKLNRLNLEVKGQRWRSRRGHVRSAKHSPECSDVF